MQESQRICKSHSCEHCVMLAGETRGSPCRCTIKWLGQAQMIHFSPPCSRCPEVVVAHLLHFPTHAACNGPKSPSMMCNSAVLHSGQVNPYAGEMSKSQEVLGTTNGVWLITNTRPRTRDGHSNTATCYTMRIQIVLTMYVHRAGSISSDRYRTPALPSCARLRAQCATYGKTWLV